MKLRLGSNVHCRPRWCPICWIWHVEIFQDGSFSPPTSRLSARSMVLDRLEDDVTEWWDLETVETDGVRWKLSLRFGAFLLEFKKIWNFLLEQVRYWLVQYGYPKMAMFFSRNYCMFSKVSFLMSMLDVKILHLPRAPIQAPIMLNYSRQKQPARCGFTGFNPGSSEPSFKSYPFCHEKTWKWKNDCIWVEIYHISLNHDYDYDYRGVYTSIYVHIKRLCRHVRYLERYR